jgi:hypothetical protein
LAREEFGMYISPPIAVLAILAVGLAGAAWLTPPPREVAEATVMLPTATHQKLALWGKEDAGADGRPLTVAQVIEKLAIEWEKENEAPANQPGTRVR